MISQRDVNSVDLRQLCDVVTELHRGGSAAAFPAAALEALGELIPSDHISYQVSNPSRQIILRVEEFPDPYPTDEDEDETTFFWEIFWSSLACCYPQRMGDFISVRRASEFYSQREFLRSPVSELFRVQGVRYETLVPLPPDGDIDRRLLLWRVDGPDFTDREQALLSLLRPHLAEYDVARRAKPPPLPLTARQLQILTFVAAGLTNQQIANRLRLSHGTVRRHLENIFQSLGVNSRTAAAGYLRQVAGVPDGGSDADVRPASRRTA